MNFRAAPECSTDSEIVFTPFSVNGLMPFKLIDEVAFRAAM
jgi:hypothetical protein